MRLGILFLTAVSAFGQCVMGFSSSLGKGPDGAMTGSATFNISTFLPRAVTNAPYSGEEVRESSQTLADGTHITRPMIGPHRKTWRDAQGRVRTEQLGLGKKTDGDGPAVIVEICDPVGGFVYVLDNVSHVAHRVPVEARTPRAATARPAGPAGMSVVAGIIGSVPAAVAGGGGGGVAGGGAGAVGRADRPFPRPTIEDLGTKTIDGVLVSGTRRTIIIPEGAQGNDRPMTTWSETWISQELHLTVLEVSYSPVNGTTTRKIANLNTADPDPSLFIAPPDYSVVDKKSTFEIKWGQQ